jgi:hypothetical protein
MRLNRPVAQGPSGRLSPAPFSTPLGNASEIIATAGAIGGHARFYDLPYPTSYSNSIDHRVGDLHVDRIQEIADHLIRSEDLRFLRGTDDPNVFTTYFAGKSATARWCIDSLLYLTDRCASGDHGRTRKCWLFLTSPLFRRLVLLRAVLDACASSRRDWTSLLLHVFARRLDKSPKSQPVTGKADSSDSSAPLAKSPLEIEEHEEHGPDSFGCTASEALKTEVLDNLSNDLARLLFLASLFDRRLGQYVDHSRSERFGADATDRAALRAHTEVFKSLTEARLEDLADLLFRWADTEPEGFATVTDEWRANRTYRLLAPRTAEEGESQVFESNIKLAIDLAATKLRGKPKSRVSRDR